MSQQDQPLFAEFPPVSTEAWWEKIRADLGAGAEEQLTWRSIDDITLKAFYRAEDRAGEQDAPLPDIAAGWRIRQDLFHANPAEANAAARRALDGGATDLGFRAGDWSADALRRALDGIDLEHVPLHFDAGTCAPALLTAWQEVAGARGVPPQALRGSLTCDPLAALARTGTLDLPAHLDRAAGLARRAAEQLPHVHVLAADARVYHEAGASAVQELGCTAAAVSDLLARLAGRGCAAETVARALHVVVPVSTSFFVEAAKLRALRLLLPQVMDAYATEQNKPATRNSQLATIPLHAVASRRTETRYDPHVNLLRGTTAALAAALGGADLLALRPFDAQRRAGRHVPHAFADRLARNTQLLLQEEAHVGRVADPAAGSYYVETATDALARAAWSFFQEIEAEGGLAEALKSGHVQRAVLKIREERLRHVATRRHVLVGVNHYPDLDETHQDNTHDDDAAAPRREDAAQAKQDSARALRVEALRPIRLAEAFEALRRRTEAHAARTGAAPVVFLLPVGPASARSARAAFVRNVFGCAGFRIVEPLGFEDVEDGAAAALDAGADLVVLCSDDGAYAEATPALCRALGAQADAGPPHVLVAGNPDEQDALRAAGVSGFLHRGQHVPEMLEEYQKRLGIS